MSLLGLLLGRPGPTTAQPAPPVTTPPAPAGPQPLAPVAAGTDSGATSGGGSGTTSTAVATVTPPAPAAASSVAAASPAGTPITAPATRPAFGINAAPGQSGDSARAYAIEMQRHWRLADVIAAIGGGPRAERLIEAASRPGPVAPGSLAEALKALCPAPTLETSRTV